MSDQRPWHESNERGIKLLGEISIGERAAFAETHHRSNDRITITQWIRYDDDSNWMPLAELTLSMNQVAELYWAYR